MTARSFSPVLLLYRGIIETLLTKKRSPSALLECQIGCFPPFYFGISANLCFELFSQHDIVEHIICEVCLWGREMRFRMRRQTQPCNEPLIGRSWKRTIS